MNEVLDSDILFIGHLKESDDLSKWQRDGPLIISQENQVNLNLIAETLLNRLDVFKKRSILFIASSKRRSIQTASLVSYRIQEKSKNKIKTRISVNENLNSYDQGTIIIPSNYQAGSYFEGLKLATDIFFKESIEKNNLFYNFGNPVFQTSGICKYPELIPYYRIYGESFAEAIIRIFNSVVILSSKINKFNCKTELAIVAHGFTFHTLRGLSILGSQIRKDNYTIKIGNFAKHIWQIKNESIGDYRNYAFVPLDFTNMFDKKLIHLLSLEVEYLQKKF